MERYCTLNHSDGDGNEIESPPVHIELLVNEYSKLKRSADNSGTKTVSELNRSLQNDIIGNYGVTGRPSVTTERSSVRAKNIAHDHDIVSRDTSSYSVAPSAPKTNIVDLDSSPEKTYVSSNEDNNRRKKGSRKKARYHNAEATLDEEGDKKVAMAKVLKQMVDNNDNTTRDYIELGRYTMQQKAVKEKSEYMTDRLKLHSDKFIFEKKEKRLVLYKELRDSAMNEYREEKDEVLKGIHLETLKNAQEEYMNQLKKFD